LGRSVIYLDTNVIIRFLEGDAAARHPVELRLKGVAPFAVSQLSRLECRCLPIRNADGKLLALYDAFFASPEVLVLDLSAAMIDEATIIRAKHSIKTADAIHLAAASISGCSTFLTGDVSLGRITSMNVEII
jgi:predicted nucleic acid-binding protein